jgi:predicted ATPase
MHPNTNMITDLKITNFKGIKKGEIQLSPLTILVGGNNAGKTTILEALFLAPNPFRQVPYGDTASAIIRKLHSTLDSAGYGFLMPDYQSSESSIECIVNGSDYILKTTASGDYIYFTSNLQKPGRPVFQFNVAGSTINAFGTLGLRTDIVNSQDQTLFIGDALLINPSLVSVGYSHLRKNWATVMNSGVSRKILQELRPISAEKYTDITLEPFVENTFALYAFKDDGKRVRLGDLGEGIQNYIVARLLFEISQPELLLWDDIESHFNPRILLRLSEWFDELIKSGKQVILATHSLEAIRLLTQDKQTSASILLTSIDNNKLKVKSLSPDEVMDLQRAGIDIRTSEPFLL